MIGRGVHHGILRYMQHAGPTKVSPDRLQHLRSQDGRPGTEGGGQYRVVGAKAFLLNLDGSHQEGIRFIELALSEKGCFKLAVPGDQAIQPHLCTVPQPKKSSRMPTT